MRDFEDSVLKAIGEETSRQIKEKSSEFEILITEDTGGFYKGRTSGGRQISGISSVIGYISTNEYYSVKRVNGNYVITGKASSVSDTD